MACGIRLLLNGFRVLPLRVRRTPAAAAFLFVPSALVRPSSSFSTPIENSPTTATAAAAAAEDTAAYTAKDTLHYSRADNPDYRRWKDNEAEILSDIDPVIILTKDILHSNRYMDGETLTPEDEKVVVERLLAYHPHSEDKIGCGLNSIMVDRHPQFRNSRCLFVVRTDGGWIDFSYQKCLRAYIREKYPFYADRFIREHFKRT